jgi:toxin ParE1/3/4
VKIRWMAVAKQDRAGIIDHILADNPRAAARMDRRFTDAAIRLANLPMLGRPGKIPGTRELIPHENYRLVYEVQGDTVWILALIHTARQWPPTAD